jgi:hypothetical protein
MIPDASTVSSFYATSTSIGYWIVKMCLVCEDYLRRYCRIPKERVERTDTSGLNRAGNMFDSRYVRTNIYRLICTEYVPFP